MTSSHMARWIVTFVAVLLIIALLAFARGDEDRGADTTAVTTDEVVTTTPASDELVTTTTGS